MGVYIKDMKLPTSCRKCMISQPDGCGWICPIIESKPIVDGRVNSRHPHCPLVLVPPHGRLGDLDSFALLVLNWISTQEKAYPHEDSNALAWRLGAKAMANQIYRDVKAYPTIIPAEEDEP